MSDTSTLSADLLLVHAPSVFDFRQRDDVVFAYLSDSDSVNVTPIYEMYPLGFLAMKGYLSERGLSVEILNLASLMLKWPDLDVEKLVGRLRAPVFGIDLHWLPHAHGAIEVARLVKRLHPEAVVIVGGISATYFAGELALEPAIDAVVEGYDTLEPLRLLVEAVKRGERRFDAVPNLVLRDGDGGARRTGFTHRPTEAFADAPVDWSFFLEGARQLAGGRHVMTLPTIGCKHDCAWCGGSRSALRRVMKLARPVHKPEVRLLAELRALAPAARSTTIYALQCYSQTSDGLARYLDVVEEVGIRSVSFELFDLPDDARLQRMAQATQAWLMLSPESHDRAVARLAGRGVYSMEAMEAFIARALDAGIAGVMVWFFIGLEGQTALSVRGTVDYAGRLLERFPGGRVLPVVCPMAPFLDPGSRIFEAPARHGYRLFHRSLADHRRALVEPVWSRRLNYETRWMSRAEIQASAYEAAARLATFKAEVGALPRSFARAVLGRIDVTTSLLGRVDEALEGGGPLPSSLRAEIRAYNAEMLSFCSDQVVPSRRPLQGRWFDDYATPPELVRACRPEGA